MLRRTSRPAVAGEVGGTSPAPRQSLRAVFDELQTLDAAAREPKRGTARSTVELRSPGMFGKKLTFKQAQQRLEGGQQVKVVPVMIHEQPTEWIDSRRGRVLKLTTEPVSLPTQDKARTLNADGLVSWFGDAKTSHFGRTSRIAERGTQVRDVAPRSPFLF